MDAQLKKGVLEMCVLFIISRDMVYGYDVIKRVREIFPEVGESSVYAVLRRLRVEGSAEAFEGRESLGPPRKYYRATSQGRLALSRDVDCWRRVCLGVETLGVLAADL